MSEYRRYYVPGGTYFFTVVTYNRRPILTTENGRAQLRLAIETVRAKRPFKLVATVLMPDHWHLVMTLPRGDDQYSIRMKQIKESFTRGWLSAGPRRHDEFRHGGRNRFAVETIVAFAVTRCILL